MKLQILSLLFLILLGAGSQNAHAKTSVSGPTGAPGKTTDSQTTTQTVFDLKAFGAVGDGTTDDGPALQNALNAIAQAGGGTLFVPAGRYAIVTPVAKNFSGLATDVTISGVASSTVVPPVTAGGQQQAETLDLVSEFLPKTGPQATALDISGLENFTIKDISFYGTPEVLTDAFIILSLTDIWSANIIHCEFYGLSSWVNRGGIVFAIRSHLKIEQTKFLGSFCSSAYYCSVVQNLEWKGLELANVAFVDYGLRPGHFGKSYYGATFSWVGIGNAAQPEPKSPRREVVLRDVMLDEGSYVGISSLTYRYQPPSAPIDLVYITNNFMNVPNLGQTGSYFWGLKGVFIEKSHYGWSHNTHSAIWLEKIDNAIIDESEFVDGANRITADAATGKLTIINSIYTTLTSDAQTTRVITTDTPEEDPVQYVRQKFVEILGRVPDPAAHFYWSNRILDCVDNAQCDAAQRAALLTYLNTGPPANFSISGQLKDENGNVLQGATVTLSGSQSVASLTDTEGKYSFSKLPTSGVYTVTPSRINYTFNPADRTFTTPNNNQTADFTAIINRHTISGRILNSTGQAVSGANVQLSGSQTGSVTTDSSGNYSFTVKAEGNYTITPTKLNYVFNPTNAVFNNLVNNKTQDFTGSLTNYTLSGQVTSEGQGLSGVTVTLSGSQAGNTTTDSTGNYSFAVIAEGNYTITPSRTHYTFAPANVTFNNLSANQTANFAATLNRYSISGKVIHESNGLSGVTVSLSGSQTGTTTTIADGSYSFSNLPAGGNYTITASKANYTLSPAVFNFPDLSSNQTANFSSSAITYTLSGVVTSAGAGLSGVTLNLTGSQTATTTTGANGSYFFTVASGGNYTVSPSKANYAFTPGSFTINQVSGNQTANFAGSVIAYTLSGVITSQGTGLGGVTVNLSGAETATVTTGPNGNYSFTVAAGGNYTVTPSKLNYSFNPPGVIFTQLSGNQVANFTGILTTYTLSGVVTSQGTGLSGVTINLSGSQVWSTSTDANGAYTIPVPAGGNYTVTPSRPNYVFNPTSFSVNQLSSNQIANFITTITSVIGFSAPSYSVNEEAGTLSVTVSRTGDTSGAAEVIYSASNNSAQQGDDVSPVIGLIKFAPGETSKQFTILITDDSFVEAPETMTLTLSHVTGAGLGNNSTAILTIADNDTGQANSNPVDDAVFFVRQHYRDFLNREPDAEGLAFWSRQITDCGSDAGCVADRRVNVSGAFFLSIEFQETGFLVYRLYKASFARIPRHVEEFLLDTHEVGAGVVVNTPGWRELLDANKASFIESFVSRDEFTQNYPNTLTPSEFVNSLNASAGDVLSPSEIAQAILEFGGAAGSADLAARMRVAQRVVENQAFIQRETNPAFVLMQYYGYLQRNPNDPPDDDFEGYNFWLGKLNEFNGDFRRAEMVNSFIVSSEYRSRFGAQ